MSAMKTISTQDKEATGQKSLGRFGGRATDGSVRRSGSSGRHLLIEYLVFAGLLSALAAIDQQRVRGLDRSGQPDPGIVRVANWLEGANPVRNQNQVEHVEEKGKG
jgi:hypothetical protein